VFLAWLLWLAGLPLWLPLALVIDAVRRRRGVALRSCALATVYLTCEVGGMIASGLLWCWKGLLRVAPDRWADAHFRLEAWWGATLFGAVVRIFGLRVEVEGEADLGRGPYLLLVRHASTADTLLASALVSRPYRFRLRYVLKRELLWDPCLDIVGNRLPNVFLDRASDDVSLEIRRIQELGQDLGPRDGVLIYPEGTRFSPEKRERVLQRLRQQGDAALLAAAQSMACVLPPRPGGTLALLEAAPEADVLVCEHTGFEGAATPTQVWKGDLIGQTIRVRFRRIPRHEFPSGREARIAWLREEWRRVSAWVESH
jgi:1-acyl-sn-glycerol-3-phosphate acyltransferase